MEFWVEAWRCVLVIPEATAEACSATSTVTRSSIRAARTSLLRSVRRAVVVQSEPGEPTGAADPGEFRKASCMYRSRGESSGGLSFFAALDLNGLGIQASQGTTVHAIARSETRYMMHERFLLDLICFRPWYSRLEPLPAQPCLYPGCARKNSYRWPSCARE